MLSVMVSWELTYFSCQMCGLAKQWLHWCKHQSADLLALGVNAFRKIAWFLSFVYLLGCYDTQHNDILNNNTQYNGLI